MTAKVYLDSTHLYGHRLNCDCAVQSILSADTAALASSIDSVEIDFTGCGDSILLAAMQSQPPFSIASIQPNPAQKSIHVLLSKADESPVTVELYDILGTQILSQNESGTDFTLDLGAAAAGIYYLRLSAEGGTVTRKIEVMK